MDISDKITHWRNVRGYSTTKLAKLAGIAQSTLREIEFKNTSPSWDTIVKLCLALKITELELIATNDSSQSKDVSSDDLALAREIKNLAPDKREIIETVIKVDKASKDEQTAAEGK